MSALLVPRKVLTDMMLPTGPKAGLITTSQTLKSLRFKMELSTEG